MSYEFIVTLILSCLAVNVSPGPSILLVTSVSAARGFKAALFTILGMNLGAFVHVLLAASGLAAVLAASPLTFKLIQYLGAAYLTYLGIELIRKPAQQNAQAENSQATDHCSHFRRGLLVDLFNPKIALFFLAFLPQFLGWLEAPGFLLSLLLGSVFLLTGILVNTSIAWLVCAGMARTRGRFTRLLGRWIPGSVLIYLGFRLLAQKS